MPKNILVIRFGALGDIFIAMQAFQDLRRHYADARISFLTTPPFAELARAMPWFNEVLVYRRMPFYRLDEWFQLARQMLTGGYDLVFDFQNKPRSAFYNLLFFKWRGVSWVDSAWGKKFFQREDLKLIHYQEVILDQIRALGVPSSGPLNTDWLHAPLDAFSLPANYVVLIPGCSAHMLLKRWPAERYLECAAHYHNKGLTPVLIGTQADAEPIRTILQGAPYVLSLQGRTSLAQMASLFRGAKGVIGNDTGPMHLAALVGAPTLGILSSSTDPVRSRPLGPRAGYIKRDHLAELPVQDVLLAAEKQMAI